MADARLRLEIIMAAVDRATAPIRALQNGTSALSKNVREAKTALRDLERQQGAVQTFREMTAASKQTGTALRDARQKLAALRAEAEASGGASAELAGKLKQAEIAVEKLTAKQRKQIDAAKQARKAIEDAGGSTKQLAAHESALASKTEQATAELKRQESALAAAAARTKQLAAVQAQYQRGQALRSNMAGAGAGMMAGGAAVGAAVMAPIAAFAQAEDSATQLRVAMMGAGGKVQAEYGQVIALAEKLGATLPGTTAEFQDMMRILIQKGLDAKVVLGGAGEATAKLAILTQAGFAEAGDAISVFQDSMGVADKDMVAAADQMQRLYNVGMKIPDIREGFKAIGPSLTYIGAAGIDAVKKLAPLLAITDAAGINASTAGIAYNSIIRHSLDAKKVKESNALLKGTGINLKFTDDKGNFAGIENLVNQVMKLKNLSHTQKSGVISKLFGNDAQTMDVLNALMKAGNEGIAQMSQKLENQASLQERIGAQLGTLKNLWDAAGGAFTGFLVKLGDAVSPQVKSLTEWIADVSDRLGKWAEENPKLSGTLMTLAGGLAIVLALGGALMVALAALLGPMLIVNAGFGLLSAGAGPLSARLLTLAATSFPGLTAAVVGFGAALMATPIGWIIAGIAAIVVIGLVLYRYWDTIAAFFGGAFDGLIAGLRTSSPMFSEMLDYAGRFVGWIGELIGGLTATSDELGAASSAGVQFGLFLAMGFDLALTSLKILWATIKSVVAAYNEISAGNWSGALGAAATAFGSVFEKHDMSDVERMAHRVPAPAKSALNDDMSDVERMARKSPLPAQTPLRAAAAGNATVTQHVNVTVNTQPGADANAVGQAAASATQKMMQQTTRDTRAALYDRD